MEVHPVVLNLAAAVVMTVVAIATRQCPRP